MQIADRLPKLGANWRSLLPGVLFVTMLASLAAILANWPVFSAWGFSALTIAIGLGILVGNTVLPRLPSRLSSGIDFSRSTLLRLGIILFGFRISLADIVAVGLSGIALAVLIVGSTFTLALWLGTRWLGLDRRTAVLIGAGSAICGAAAIMGAQSVVRASERSTSVAVATVVVFGTLSMLLYPLMQPLLNLTPFQFGLYAGATIHEVAQVVAVGAAVGIPEAANAAVIEKMLRVVMLAPFLLVLAMGWRAPDEHGSPPPRWRQTHFPWFAIVFLGAVVIHSTGWIPNHLISPLVQAANLLLAMGMAAIGLRTSASNLRAAGLQPIKLAAGLFLFLTTGGYLLTRLLTA